MGSARAPYSGGGGEKLVRHFFVLVPSFHPTGPVKGAVALANAFQRFAEALACFEEAERLGSTQAAEGIALCRQELGQS